MTVAFFDEPLQLSKRPANLKTLNYAPVERKLLSQQEAMCLPVGSEVTCDVETFKNFFFVGFKHLATGSYFYWQIVNRYKDDPFILHCFMLRFLIVTFNGNSYDLPLIRKAIKGADCAELKTLSDTIIREELRRDDRGQQNFNHIDLIEVAPLQASLKAYTARLHAQRIQELPVDPHTEIDLPLSRKIIDYNFNDLDCTELLLNSLREQIKLREQLSKQYGSDMRSKSDAQIAEAVISNEFQKLTGERPKKPEEIPATCTYTPPAYMRFQTQQLRDVLATIQACTFNIGAAGYAVIPPEIEGLRLTIGKQVYRMSIGGLHSSETCVSYRADENNEIIDCDVASYYPKIILNSGIAPENMGTAFLDIYGEITERRIAAKKAKNTVEADSLKITTNGTFGKLGSPYSIMYSPELMLYVTLTGQLQLLLIIEAATILGFEIVSANTDGVVFIVPTNRNAQFNAMLKAWELNTNFEFEQTPYLGYFARDVNNYFAIKTDRSVKAKGAYTEKGSALNSVLSKNPFNLVVLDAVKDFLAHEIPIEETIYGCKDIRRFVAVQNVRSPGAHKDGYYLGRVVRWYYAQGEAGAIHRVSNGNQVPRSTGARPLMELPADLPADLNFQYYIAEAYGILDDIGYYGAKQVDFFTGA